MTEQQVLEAARGGDEDAFAKLIYPYRRELHAHCYRMLGSAADAEDALQDALLGAWRGLPRFEGRSSLRSWLYTIATNACLRAIERRPKRVLPIDYGPASDPHDPTGEPLLESVWVQPLPDTMLADAATPACPLRAARGRRARVHRRPPALARAPAGRADPARRARVLRRARRPRRSTPRRSRSTAPCSARTGRWMRGCPNAASRPRCARSTMAPQAAGRGLRRRLGARGR